MLKINRVNYINFNKKGMNLIIPFCKTIKFWFIVKNY